MGLQIFATDPDAMPTPKPEKTYSNDYSFQFRSGKMVDKRPVSLATWRVLAADYKTGDAVAELLGGTNNEDGTAKYPFAIDTDAESVEIVIAGSAVIEDKLIQWSNGLPVHECDGVSYLSPAEDKGEPCGCPKLMSQRKEAARKNRGPKPNIVVPFFLAQDPELGKGVLVSTAWTLAGVIHTVKNDLDAVNGEALCTLTLELVEYESEKFGKVSYRKPVIKVLGSYNDAIAE